MSKFYLYCDSTRTRIRANAIAFIEKLPDKKPFVISVDPYKKERTLSQNAGLFAVGYPPLMEFMGLRGNAEKEELHRHFCGEYFGWVDKPFGHKKPRRTTTTDENNNRDVLPWDKFSDFYQFVQQQALEFGVDIPDPDPLWRERKQEGRTDERH